MSNSNSDLRERFGRMVGMLGSSSAAEAENARAAIDRALSAAGLTWAWLSDLVASGELPDSDLVRRRARLVASLLIPRVNEALSLGYSMTATEGAAVSFLKGRIDTGAIVADLACADGIAKIEAAVDVMASVRRRCGKAA